MLMLTTCCSWREKNRTTQRIITLPHMNSMRINTWLNVWARWWENSIRHPWSPWLHTPKVNHHRVLCFWRKKPKQKIENDNTQQRTEQKITYKWNEDEKGKVFLSPSEFIVRHPKEMRREACKRWFSINKSTYPIELLDIECALCHVTGVKFAILDFLQKLPFSFAQNVLGRAHFALINPPFCGDNFLTDTR